MKKFEAFKETLSSESLKAIYEETKLEVANDEREGTEAFSAALATQMAINLVEKYHEWLNENK
ncbi:hypothetical protein ACRPMK_06155 [Streptococcus uberis]|uniref:Uncharacterized protein n=2 Tax=Streptococcus uberis TaxID=1349 RepID=B9DW23_STRU0|nr:hypothetical protein [Streptococcus uberis]KHD40081.1 hypothetical protein NA32_07675 [Streptococcus hongkongensis]AUC25751.1 hypothetical protein CGZ53_08860 [Streptococcus uberis]KKF40427.1 hypothetical protein AF63_08605 [Streptococcus uberis Ab71]KKF40828.1 hypothetical protein AF64_08590 [Streptococcus uberis C9359]KKF41306.1 hypothetical protein AF61_01515 [Streptococcus uberis EF20/0145]